MHSTVVKNALRSGTISRSSLDRSLFIMISEFLISVSISIFSILNSDSLVVDSPQSTIRFDNASLAQSSGLDILRRAIRDPRDLLFGLLKGRRGIETNRVNWVSH